LRSAVSQIFNLLGVGRFTRFEHFKALPMQFGDTADYKSALQRFASDAFGGGVKMRTLHAGMIKNGWDGDTNPSAAPFR